MLNLPTNSAKETEQLGKILSQCLKQGSIIGLIGNLGAGKTVLIKGICKGLNVKENVGSPTFTLINEYKGKYPVSHIDCYREMNIKEWIELGINEYFYSNGIVLVEWAEKIEEIMPKDAIYIFIHQDINRENYRLMEIKTDNEFKDCILRKVNPDVTGKRTVYTY
jgi:tRNA threonylcarbamoyladenosine biosynthesis protein TsaE